MSGPTVTQRHTVAVTNVTTLTAHVPGTCYAG